MANMTLLSNYSIGDTNFDAVMTTLDATRRVSFSLSNFDNTSAPVIEAGSIIDVGGALYEALTDVTISTTDPYTSSTVADGVVYIVLQASGSPSTVSAAWTATAPVWRADYQGYYKTATVDRYIGGCVLSGTHTVYSGKYGYNENIKYTAKEDSDFIATETQVVDSSTLTDCTGTLSATLNVEVGDLIRVFYYCDMVTSDAKIYTYLSNTGTCTFLDVDRIEQDTNLLRIETSQTSYVTIYSNFYYVILTSGTLKFKDQIQAGNSLSTISSKNRGIFLKKENLKPVKIS